MFRGLLLGVAALALGGCHQTPGYVQGGYYPVVYRTPAPRYEILGFDEGARYLQRKDTVTLSAGDAKEVNARTHMLTPWPPGVGDRRIPANGARMVERAIVPYRGGEQSDNGGGALMLGATVGAAAGAAAAATKGAAAGETED